MKFLRKYILSLVLASSAVTLNAQSADFKTGKALEAQYNILRELSVGFVDTVDVEELVNVGIDAMLNSLDPYTEYIPDENEEDLEMMRTAS